MSGDFDAEVKNSIRSIQSVVEGLTKAQTRLNDEMRRLGQEAHQAFARVPKVEPEKIENFGRALKEVGHALSYIHGPLGEITHRLTGGSGMEGGLGRIAAAAGVAGIAIQAMNAVVERQVEDVKRAAEAHENYYKAIEKGREVHKRQAEAGLGQAPGHRRLLAAGGQEAVDAAEDIAQRGVASPEDAERVTAKIYGKLGNTGRARATLSLANQLAATGMDINEAGEALLKAGGNVNDPTSGHRIAARIYQEKSGRFGNPEQTFDQALAAVQGDPLLDAATEAGGYRNRIRGIERSRGISEGPNFARGDFADAQSPVLAAVKEVQQASERQVQILEEAAKQQGLIARAMATFGLLTGGEGSLANQAERAKRINGTASLQASDDFGPGG